MKLPGFLNKLTAKKENKVDYFLSLLFTEDKVKAAIWKKENGNGVIVESGEKEVGENWEEITKTVDLLISEISKTIPQNELNKVIYGLPSTWVDLNKIKPEYLTPLKKLASDLSLTPIGFIVIDDAIINYLSKIEGAPATTILLGFRKKKFFITISRIGKIEGTVEKEKKEGVALCEEIATSLKEDFKQVEVLPSKFLLYNGRESLESVQQELISYPWLTKAEFLHFPKIEILEKDFDLKALIFSTASEMNVESNEALPNEPVTSEAKVLAEDTKIVEQTPIVEEKEEKSVLVDTPDNLGFVINQDIAKNNPLEMPDLTEIRENPIVSSEKIIEEKIIETPIKKPFSFPKFNLKLPKLPKLNINFSFLINSGSKGIIIGVSAAILVVGLVLGYWYLPKAKLTLYVIPKVQEKEEQIIVSPNIDQVSVDKKTIPGYSINTDEKGNKKINTTGKKIVGDKAKGEVIIYNKTNYSKTFNSGTTIFSNNNLKFTLNDDITIASQSSTENSGGVTTTYGKSKVKVTAVNIGTDRNLSANNDFKIEDFSTDTYSAKNESAFSGGTSREISVVSENDQAKLLDSLNNDLTNKGKADLVKKISSDQSLIDKTLDTSIISKKFSADVGDESNDLSLDLSLKISSLYYKNSDLTLIINKLVEKSIPKNYLYNPDETTKEVKDAKVKTDKSIALNMFFKISLLPKIDSVQVKKELAGKNVKVSKEYLDNLSNVSSYTIEVSPKLPSFLYTFPHIANNIEVVIKRK